VRILAVIFFSWVLAEFYGYWLHVMLHSDKWRWFSKRHMDHHLKCYIPVNGKKLRTEEYIQEKGDHFYIAGLGLEWFFPAIFLIAFTAGFEWLLVLTLFEIIISESILILYSIFLFWYLHDRMHVKNVWILKVPFLKDWFKIMRRKHDIHHCHITDDGLMNSNFGIAFSIFDHVFGTHKSKLSRLNRRGIEAAYDRYKIPKA
jgi:sterol desaturase/sphingolipid hydroxylase (fatty acid hydroxylase superfamily)